MNNTIKDRIWSTLVNYVWSTDIHFIFNRVWECGHLVKVQNSVRIPTNSSMNSIYNSVLGEMKERIKNGKY